MQWLWIFYWLLILGIPIWIAICALRKKNYLYGSILLVLSILVPLFHTYFLEISSWNGDKGNEFVYLIGQIGRGNIGAIFLVLGYIAVLVLCYVNIRTVKKFKY